MKAALWSKTRFEMLCPAHPGSTLQNLIKNSSPAKPRGQAALLTCSLALPSEVSFLEPNYQSRTILYSVHHFISRPVLTVTLYEYILFVFGKVVCEITSSFSWTTTELLPSTIGSKTER